jgi:methylglyoxal synthase
MAHFRLLAKRKRIAWVAHDNKKSDLIAWAEYIKEVLAKHSTGTTGKLIDAALERPLKKLLSGPLGGDQQIGSMISKGDIDIMIFFWDPMEAQPHDSDVKALLRLCVAWNIPMACDRATADFLMTSPFKHETFELAIPDYTQYLTRKIETPNHP